MKYKGWIPVASGFLSFSNIRGQVITGRCQDAPAFNGSLDSIGSDCQITSTRTLIDRPLGALRSVLGSIDERYDFELRASRHSLCDGDEMLEGCVIAHPKYNRDDAAYVRKQDKPRPGIYADCLCWVVNFQLTRDGCITLDWGDLRSGSISKIVDVAPEDEEAAERLLTFETFSFLKDLIHNHKFHSIDDDSIVVPIKVTSDNDCTWKDETARNLHRAIISSLRSTPAQLELTNALGKLGYLNTFLRIAGTNFSNKLLASLDNLEKTIQARLQQQSFFTGAADVIKSTWITILLACIATAMTLFQLLQIPCIEGLNNGADCKVSFSVPSSAIWLTSTLLENWITFFIGIFVTLCSLGYLACRRAILELYSQRTGSDELDWHIMRFFYGLALTQGKYMALFWLTILAAALLSLIGYIIYSLIRW